MAATVEDLDKKQNTACSICPHRCNVNRYQATGICGEGSQLRLAQACLHFGEEPIITGTGGSGTIFVTGCNLQCAFCQNYQISQEGLGTTVTEEEFVRLCLRLQDEGAENINIVTGTHQSLLLVKYLTAAKALGLKIPVVWNSSAYETSETIQLLSTVLDIYLADLKTSSEKIACNVFKASDYVSVAKTAIETMCSTKPLLVDWSKAKMVSGVIVRHLALPGALEDSFEVLRWFSKLKDKALLSLMTQYTPVKKNSKNENITSFENRLLKTSEDETLKSFLQELEIENGFYQELSPDYSWLPDFTKVKTFSSKLSKPIWHYSCGFL